MGATLYTLQAIWMENYITDATSCIEDRWCGTFLEFAAAFSYTLSSVFCIFEGLTEARNEQILTLFTADHQTLNWFLWGDIFFVISSVMFLVLPLWSICEPFGEFSIRHASNFYVATNLIMFFDSLFYQIGYHKHIIRIRTKLLQSIEKITTDHVDLEWSTRDEVTRKSEQVIVEANMNNPMLSMPLV